MWSLHSVEYYAVMKTNRDEPQAVYTQFKREPLPTVLEGETVPSLGGRGTLTDRGGHPAVPACYDHDVCSMSGTRFSEYFIVHCKSERDQAGDLNIALNSGECPTYRFPFTRD